MLGCFKSCGPRFDSRPERPNLDVHTNGSQEPCWHALCTTTLLGEPGTQILPVQYHTTKKYKKRRKIQSINKLNGTVQGDFGYQAPLRQLWCTRHASKVLASHWYEHPNQGCFGRESNRGPQDLKQPDKHFYHQALGTENKIKYIQI